MNLVKKIFIHSVLFATVPLTIVGKYKFLSEKSVGVSDEIIPVPHELINSVKKANKEKKKLEKLEKNKRKKFLKRQKNRIHE